MIYIDSNLFLYSALDTGEKGAYAESIMKKIELGEMKACTSYLTYDEFFYKIKKKISHEIALKLSFNLVNLSHIIFFDLNREIVLNSHSIMQTHRLNPRDALHISSALFHGVHEIISEDTDFDVIPFIKRFWMTQP